MCYNEAMLMQLVMVMLVVGQEPASMAEKEAGAFLMLALVAMGGAAVLAILVMMILGRRMRKRKSRGDWRLDWELEEGAKGGDAWQESAERVSGDDFEGEEADES